MLFSSRYRKDMIQKMQNEIVDVLIIGGGITGAGIALDAQTRGMSTALIDMQDFAAGTSSRSTKLVHGGLRYLRQFEVKMVAEVGQEREIVYENGPHVTHPEWMLLPLYKGGTFGKIATSMGLRVYDALAKVKKEERRTMLSAAQTIEKEPLLKRDRLIGGGYYVEYRTDDARLTIEVIKKAVEHGALAANYVKVTSFLYVEQSIVGVQAIDQLDGTVYTIRARRVVNAAGPWVDTIRELDRSRKGKQLHLTKGVHIVFAQRKFPLKQAIYFDGPDHRMIFAIPREGKTYVGTTDTEYPHDPLHPRITREDREYLLRATLYMFPTLSLTLDDIESSWAGIRPLIHEEGKGPSEISRHDEIFHSRSGLISIAGGKLTGYRKMAESIVNRIAAELKTSGLRHYTKSKTKHLPISGGDVGGSTGFPTYVEQKVAEGIALGLSKEVAERLVQQYGSNIDTLHALIDPLREAAVAYELPLEHILKLQYAIEYEMAVTPTDFFIRRTGALFFAIDWVLEYKEKVIRYMAEQLQWTEEQTEQYRQALEQELYYATHAEH